MIRARWPRRRPALPPELISAFAPEETALASTPTGAGGWLAVTRFGLWVADDAVLRWGWETISRAVLREQTLTITVTEVDTVWPDGTEVLLDRPPRDFPLPGPARLTDAVNARVRRSVAASAYLAWPGAGGWVVLRRVPGRDGLLGQVRLDPGADPTAPGFAVAVTGRLTELRGPEPAE